MGYITVITGENLIEGIAASVTFAFLIYIITAYGGRSRMVATMVAWFFTWVLRKFSVNLYNTIMEQNSFPVPTPILRIWIPNNFFKI